MYDHLVSAQTVVLISLSLDQSYSTIIIRRVSGKLQISATKTFNAETRREKRGVTQRVKAIKPLRTSAPPTRLGGEFYV